MVGKKKPNERWAAHVAERVVAFRHSKEFRRLRRRGLAVIGKTRLLSTREYWQGWHGWLALPRYMIWCQACLAAGENFGLASWTVETMCLLRDYQPDQYGLVAEVRWPRVTVVSEVEDARFQQWLGYYSRQLELRAVFKEGPVERVLLWLEASPPPEELPASSLPPRQAAFWMRVEVPSLYPPEARAGLEREAAKLERVLLSMLGYTGIPRRLRSSPLVKKAGVLKAGTAKLPSRGLYEMAARESREGTRDEDRQRVKTLKTQRHRVRKRLRPR
jgi:hypothetical protein